ncbi:SURF1 family protein [Pseudoduganella sp. FT26W]|uniref:SURF1-like protein n=1 Tax=Duganella aquatilis TaxID=2666082 RepID=A0A844CZ68_9BURK|nr:SURF1 family cytochrome oxidase biogenesis protein [Duganella aquatilis]MRW82795.1 SURF1 family protein [Duganella aquatilis]
MMAGASKRQRSRALRVILVLAAGVMFAGFFALGTWQVFRLQWKLALIERVDQRVHAAPVPAPSMAQWPRLTAEADEYRRVQLGGVLLDGATTQVLASLDRGIGYWTLTPLCTADGGIVMINRGFIPAGVGGWKPQPAPPMAAADACKAAQGPQVSFSGLLRLNEVAGRLRQNEPARNYWYTRDLQAIAQARGLPAVAPYFVDADAASAGAAGPVAGQQPVGGLTVISFVNNHLVYAITWYALALMVAAAAVWVIRDARKQK